MRFENGIDFVFDKFHRLFGSAPHKLARIYDLDRKSVV